MSSKFNLILIVLLLIVSVSMTSEAQNLVNRSRIEIRGGAEDNGLDNNVTIGINNVEVSSGTGTMVAIGYSKYIQENLAITIFVSPMILNNNIGISIGVVNTGTSTVTPVYIGARYYVFESTYGKSMRPYLSFAAGPVIGSESETNVDMSVEFSSHNETAFGAKLGLGVDFLVSRSFIIGLDGGYNAMSNFSNPILGEDNYSGAEFSLGFSFLFGGNKEE